MATTREAQQFGRNLVWFGAGFQMNYSLDVTAARTLTEQDPRLVRVDATDGAFTLTLPATPSTGCTYTIKESAGLTTAVTVSGNGKNIEGSATYSMNAAYRVRTLRYSGTQWEFIGGLA